MNIRPIRSEADYREAMAEIDRLWDSEQGTPDGDILDVLIVLAEDYEKIHYEPPMADPVETILYYMESRDLTRADLEPFIGSRARVSEILNRRRSLTLRMIQNLSHGLGIPAESLIESYVLDYSLEELYTTESELAEDGAHQIPYRVDIGIGDEIGVETIPVPITEEFSHQYQQYTKS